MAHLYTYTCINNILHVKRKILRVLSSQCYRFPVSITDFLPMLPLKRFYYLWFIMSSQVGIIKVYIMFASTSQHLSKFHPLLDNKKACAEKEKKLVLFHLFEIIIAFRGLMKITANTYGVINHSKESMLLSLLIFYWGKRTCI